VSALALIAACAAATAALRVVGPVTLGGRPLPGALAAVVALLAPALLGALVITDALADGRHLHAGAEAVGVAAGGLVAWRTGSTVGAIAAAVAITAALRAL
jgi:branched-subunit amino acid transport protein